MEFGENFPCILFPRKAVHDFKFCELDIDRVVVFAEEDFNFVLKDGRATLNDKKDVSETNVLDFGTG